MNGSMPNTSISFKGISGGSCDRSNLSSNNLHLLKNLWSTIRLAHPVALHTTIPVLPNDQLSYIPSYNTGLVNKKSFIKIRKIEHPLRQSEDILKPLGNHRKSIRQPPASIDDTGESLNDKSAELKHEETKMSTENDDLKELDLTNNPTPSMVVVSEDTNKNDYIKAIFEVVRIDRKSKRQVKLTKHRHIISHWPHKTAAYYAKGMWKKCYFSRGQLK